MEKNFISKLKSLSNGSKESEPLLSETSEREVNELVTKTSKHPQSTKKRRASTFPGKTGLLKARNFLARVSNAYQRRPLHRSRLFWATLFLSAGGAGLAWSYWTIERSLPDTGAIATFVRDGTLTIKAADGSVLQQLGPATREKLTIQQMPEQVIEAFIAAEDRRFYQHGGVDFQSIVRAAASNIVAGDVVEGASTITQQLSRIVYLNQERSLWRKLQEAFLAGKIERQLSKEQILEKYLNLVYLGSGAYGVADAAWVYFSKPVDKLTLAETAMIAGLPPAPSEYSPLVNLDIARQRRNIVLERMQESGYITETEAQNARSQTLKIKPSIPKNLYSDTPYFTSYIRQELPKHVSKEELELGGLTVETTLNPRWQQAADTVVRNAVKNIGPSEGFEQAALVAIDPQTGEIRAMVGGTDFKTSQFNRAVQAQRQPGSSFKTILYTTAIATGMSPYDSYLDAPFKVDGYEPQNYTRKYNGWMSLRDALTNSINVISVRLILDVGFDPVVRMARDMGIKSKLMPTYSLALGASEVNLLELTAAYGTLAAQGEHSETHGIRRILNRKGTVIYTASHKPKRAVDEITTAIVTWMMQNVVNSGTGRAAQLDRPVAGKTGTSEKARDLWFVGFIPQLVTGVWLGNDDNAPTWSFSSTAAEVWHDFMVSATKGMPVKAFPELPVVDGRKGSIKAQKVTGARISAGSGPRSETENQSGGSSYERSYDRSSESTSEPAPRQDYSPPSQPEPSYSAPESAPAPEPAPAEPLPPPPENTAPPELPPPDPAPPADAAPAPVGAGN